MNDLILSIDPGLATGWSTWNLSHDYPIQRLEYGLVSGGLYGFLSFIEVRLGVLRPDLIVCERFELDGRTRTPEVEPLRIEGAVAAVTSALGIEVVWQRNGMKALCRDDDLRRIGLWLENDEVEWEDARDVNDSQIHALAYAKAHDHEATVTAFWPEIV